MSIFDAEHDTFYTSKSQYFDQLVTKCSIRHLVSLTSFYKVVNSTHTVVVNSGTYDTSNFIN